MTEDQVKLIKARAFIEEITRSDGRYSKLNGTPIVAEAYAVLRLIDDKAIIICAKCKQPKPPSHRIFCAKCLKEMNDETNEKNETTEK